MAVKPIPYKLLCPKCGFNKIFAPKSDALSPKDLMDMHPICSKCEEKMEQRSFDKHDSQINGLFGMYKL
ncbi:hypothetical protein N5S72_09555 [Aliarcobacter cryaerophilus]|uniref:hypothetical protein n=1 Tax=Aliarcobacter cryaerophilus TaxID=28198 RepID=UPI0021B1B8EA|nr:hypothetical protein [Aliarcobacter cryaerophilus]MCT7464693.1 hypothetical protein [Aliarcobacter cryaerophilus]